METEIKMLSDIHKNADMGQDTLRHILDATKDTEFSKTVSRQMQEYEKAFQVSGPVSYTHLDVYKRQIRI